MTTVLERSATETEFAWATAQATGTAHIESGTPCQDALAMTTTIGTDGRRWLIAAVGDGAGSAPFAEIGATNAVEIFVSALAHSLAEEVEPNLAQHLVAAATLARFELELTAEVEGHQPGDFATTLLGCISNGTTSAFIQIGDGAIVIGPPWRVVLTPQRGECVNEAIFLTCQGGVENAALAVIDEPIGIIVLETDGLESLSVKAATLEPHAPFFDFVCDALQQSSGVAITGADVPASERLATLLDSATIRDRTDDDVTIVAIQMGRPSHGGQP